MAEREYQRLTFAAARSGFAVIPIRSSLWLAKDHLLCINSTGFGETYKRFFFRDIQSITIHRTMRRVYWNWFLGIPSAVFIIGGVPYFALSGSRGLGEMIAASVITAIFLVPLIINNILGPTCAFRIKTAVQGEELVPLRRVRKAQKTLERLRPLIVAAQGLLSPEDLAARLRGFGSEPATSAIQPTSTAQTSEPPPAVAAQAPSNPSLDVPDAPGAPGQA